MKKILVLNYEFPPLGGGAGNAMYYMLKEFAKDSELKIDLITSSVDKYKEENFADNIRIYYLDIGKQGNIHYQSNKDLIKYSFKAYRLAKKLNRHNDYDLVHAFFGIPCGFIAFLLKRPYIVSLRGSDVPLYNKRFYWLDKLIFRHLSRTIWKKAEAVVTNSQGLKDLALQTSPQQKITIIYNGIDTAQFCPAVKTNNEFTIISTSRLIKRKGIEHLITAFINFQKKYANSRLILVGDGDLKDDFVRIVKNASLDSRVDFLGSVDHEQLPSYYQRADVFVLPSLNEGMSNALLEAMASGLAIIATDTGGTRELVDDKNGIIVDKNNSNKINIALERLYSGREMLRRMQESSRYKTNKFNWKLVSDQYKCFYSN